MQNFPRKQNSQSRPSAPGRNRSRSGTPDRAPGRAPGRAPYRAPRETRPEPRPDETPPRIEVSTLWDFPSRNYGGGKQGSSAYVGATPAHVIWNLLMRYTKPDELVVDPMAGSGTTLDVAKELNRRAAGFDVNPARADIVQADSRIIPMRDGEADFVFIDPPYSTHIDYSDDPRCIGKLDAATTDYYEAMAQVISEIHRVLAPGRHMGLYVSDSFVKNKGFYPIGFELYNILLGHFHPVDIITVVRHNKTLEMGNYRRAADEGNFFLRGFNYLFIMQKPDTPPQAPKEFRPKQGGKQKNHSTKKKRRISGT